MDYKIIMPVLSDTMDKGKLIKWHVKEGDVVKKGDVVAEVESDKAIMEVQTFKSGVVKKLLIKEGDEVPVKEPIAIIDTEEKVIQKEKEEKKEIKKEEKEEKNIKNILEEIKTIKKEKKIEGVASPAAKKEAVKIGIDIKKLQKENILPTPAHLKDIEEEKLKRYFTPKALKLLKDYSIDPNIFQLNHKIDEEEVKNLIKKENIPKIVPLTSNQKAVIKNVEESSKKPIFFIFENFNIRKYKQFKLTSILLKVIGDTMQSHPKTRAILEDEYYKIYPNSNISVAVAKDNELYMVVCKNIEQKDINEIDKWVREIKTKEYSLKDLEGSTFGISNLGMFGIDRFSAMINKKDSAIAAFGALKEDSIKVTFTFDHRVINGLEAALFVEDLKKSFRSFNV